MRPVLSFLMYVWVRASSNRRLSSSTKSTVPEQSQFRDGSSSLANPTWNLFKDVVVKYAETHDCRFEVSSQPCQRHAAEKSFQSPVVW